MRREQNANTQPFLKMPVFQNWDVVAKAWYFACRSRDVQPGKAKSMEWISERLLLTKIPF
jgi:hypothetical protein